MQTVDNVIGFIVKFKTFEDGTYDFTTGKIVEYFSGYQVSFVRPEAFKQLSHQDWDTITNYMCVYLDSIAHIGVYCGDAEVSFHSISNEKSIKIMEKYNQESILDWEKKQRFPEDVASWFIINRFFDNERVIDYDKILEEIQ